MIRKKWKFRSAIFLIVLSVVVQCMTVGATAEEPAATGADWAIDMDTAPAVVAESAVLMDIDTGVILYKKNIHEKQYPASITKLLTCLVAVENSELTDVVTFSHEAVYGIERGSSHIAIDEGEQLTMEECYYAALLESANEVSSGIAEHVGGSIEGFAAMMNEKVKQLGGTDSNFVNANGLHDDNHYTSAYDMALIGQAFAKNELLLEISGTAYYHIDPTLAQPDPIDLRNHHRMLPGCQLDRRRPYEYMIGGKTGYTTVSQNTLVTFANKDGHRLICVVLKDKSPNHYTDTLALFEYGFACYENSSIEEQIEEIVKERQAGELAAEEENESREEPAAEEDGAGTGMDDNAGNRNAAGPDAEDGIYGEPEKEKSSGELILTIVVIAVVLAAEVVCGYILYRYYKREQERKRKRAEIMARHRARIKQEG